MRYFRYSHRYIVSRFWSHKPIILTHALTGRCNCRCRVCDIWIRQKNTSDEMTKDEVFALLDEAWSRNFVAYVAFGGEPLLRRDTPEILEYAHRKGFYTSMITNGTRLEEHAPRIAKSTDLVWVSLDYDSDYHDEMRGLDGVFNRAVSGIRAIKRANGRVRINCVLSRLNLDAPTKMAKLADKLKVAIAFDPMEVFPSNEEYALTMEERCNLFKNVIELKQKGYPILNSYEFLRHQIVAIRYECSQPKVFLKVNEDGKIDPFWCQRDRGYHWDLRKQSLGEILYSRDFEEFTKSSDECYACNNSSTVECSIFYSAQRFLESFVKRTNPYLRFIVEYGFR